MYIELTRQDPRAGAGHVWNSRSPPILSNTYSVNVAQKLVGTEEIGQNQK